MVEKFVKGWRKLAILAALMALVFLFAPEGNIGSVVTAAIVALAIQGGLDIVELICKAVVSVKLARIAQRSAIPGTTMSALVTGDQSIKRGTLLGFDDAGNLHILNPNISNSMDIGGGGQAHNTAKRPCDEQKLPDAAPAASSAGGSG